MGGGQEPPSPTKPKLRKIYCVGCGITVLARLTNGGEIYLHRPDLSGLPFWKCDACQNYVGCHYKSRSPTKPLGVIATRELLALRIRIHDVIDPLWKQGYIGRTAIYSYFTRKLGYTYHTGEIRSTSEAHKVLKMAKELAESVK